MKKKIVLVEDNVEFAQRVISQLDAEYSVSHFTKSADFLHNEEVFPADFYLLDIQLPDMDGISLIPEVRKKDPEANIIMITGVSKEESVFQAMKNGASGYLLKEELSDLKHQLQIIEAGGAVMTPTIAVRVFQHFRTPSEQEDYVPLTNREEQILELLVQGYTAPQVSDMIKVSIETARSHIKNIYRKLDVHSRVDLVKKAEKRLSP